MSVELLYTSAAQGLKQGSRGFCTVLSTIGMPVNLANRLESLSAYRHVFPPNSPDAAQNPVSYSHLRITVGGRPLSILSRISDYGVDYSQRTNKLAHHVVVETPDLVPAGPAWVMAQPSIMRSQWDGQCATPATGPTVSPSNQSARVCLRWGGLCIDAGWGGVVAEAFAQPPGKPLWIIFTLAQSAELLGLINESIALLPVEQRWQATFSTYATNLPPDAECKVRCVLAGTDDARLAPARGKVIDLSKPLPPIVPTAVTPFVLAARTGTAPHIKSTIPLPSRAAQAPLPKQPIESPIPEISGELFDVDEADLTAAGLEALQSQRKTELKVVRNTSAPPAIKTKLQTANSPLVNAMPKDNKLKWALIGVSVSACMLLIAIVSLLFQNNSVEVSQHDKAVSQGGDKSAENKSEDNAAGEQGEQKSSDKPDAKNSSVPAQSAQNTQPASENPDSDLPKEIPTQAAFDPNVPPPNSTEPKATEAGEVKVEDEPKQSAPQTEIAESTSGVSQPTGIPNSTITKQTSQPETSESKPIFGELLFKNLVQGSVLVKLRTPIPEHCNATFKDAGYASTPDGTPKLPPETNAREIRQIDVIPSPFALEVTVAPTDEKLVLHAKEIKTQLAELNRVLGIWSQLVTNNYPKPQQLKLKLPKGEELAKANSLQQLDKLAAELEKRLLLVSDEIENEKQDYAEKNPLVRDLPPHKLDDWLTQMKQLLKALRREFAFFDTRREFRISNFIYVGKVNEGMLVDPTPITAYFYLGQNTDRTDGIKGESKKPDSPMPPSNKQAGGK